MKCPNCCTRFTLLQRLNTNITTSKEMQCLNCKTKYKKITSFNSLCVALSYFTSIFIIEMLIKLSTINEFLLIVIIPNRSKEEIENEAFSRDTSDNEDI